MRLRACAWLLTALAATVGAQDGDIQRILSADEVKNRLAAEGAEPVLGMSPEAFGAVVKADIARWRKVVLDVGIQAQ